MATINNRFENLTLERLQEIYDLVAAGPGAITWGSITGILSSQLDLQAALNAKQNTLGFTPVPTTRTLTINGTSQDLSADRTFTIPAGLFTLTQSVAGSVITSGTPVASLVATIPANTVGSSGTIEFISKFFGAGGTGTAYLYVNTSNTIVGASLLATGTVTFPAAGFGMLARTMNYNGGTMRTLSAGSFFPSDYTSQPISFVGFNPTVTNYFFFAVSGGPAYCNSYRITIY